MRLAAEKVFELGEVVVVHHNQKIVSIDILAADFAAAKACGGNAVLLQGAARALMHVFTIVPARSAAALHMNAVRHAGFGGAVAQHIFGHGRAADVAQAHK